MAGLDLLDMPIKYELSKIMEKGVYSKCTHFDLELVVNKKPFKPFAIIEIENDCDYIANYYPVLAITFQCSMADKEMLIAGMADIEATLKTYDVGRTAPFSIFALKNPVIKKYRAKLYLAESEFISQENFAANNADYARNKALVQVKVQLVDRGIEEVKQRAVGGGYRDISGADLIKHLIDFHVNKDNDNVATMVSGVQMTPGFNPNKREYIGIPDGRSLLEAIQLVNDESGGLWTTGFSYFIHNNLWYVYPPYATNRFGENVDKLVIVNLPRDRVPGMEKTYHKSGKALTVLSTGGTSVMDKREAKKMNSGVGTMFAEASQIARSFAKTAANKLEVMANKNMNEIATEVVQNAKNTRMKFSNTRITDAKNVELSKLAPSKGFMMEIPWEGSVDTLLSPAMPVKVLYVKKNKMKSAVGSVVGYTTVYNPYEESFPVRKFLPVTFIRVFVTDENTDG